MQYKLSLMSTGLTQIKPPTGSHFWKKVTLWQTNIAMYTLALLIYFVKSGCGCENLPLPENRPPKEVNSSGPTIHFQG